MLIDLVDPSRTYELAHPSGAVFTLRHWTVAMQDSIDKSCLKYDADGRITYDVPLEREMKIDLALTAWRGVGMNDGEMPCVPENKKKLPFGVVLWLIRDIEERAGIRMPAEEKKS